MPRKPINLHDIQRQITRLKAQVCALDVAAAGGGGGGGNVADMITAMTFDIPTSRINVTGQNGAFSGPIDLSALATDSSTYYNNATGGNGSGIALATFSPTTPATPIDGDFGITEYDDGVILSVRNGGAWANIFVGTLGVSTAGYFNDNTGTFGGGVDTTTFTPTLPVAPMDGDTAVTVYDDGVISSIRVGGNWSNVFISQCFDNNLGPIEINGNADFPNVTGPFDEENIQRDFRAYVRDVNPLVGIGTVLNYTESITVNDYTLTEPIGYSLCDGLVIGGVEYPMTPVFTIADFEVQIANAITAAGGTFTSISITDQIPGVFGSQVVINGSSVLIENFEYTSNTSSAAFTASNTQTTAGDSSSWIVGHGCSLIRTSLSAFLLDSNFAENNLTADGDRTHEFADHNLTINQNEGDLRFIGGNRKIEITADPLGKSGFSMSNDVIVPTTSDKHFIIEQTVDASSDPVGGFGMLESNWNANVNKHDMLTYITSTDTNGQGISGLIVGSGGGSYDSGLALFTGASPILVPDGSGVTGTIRNIPIGMDVPSEDMLLRAFGGNIVLQSNVNIRFPDFGTLANVNYTPSTNLQVNSSGELRETPPIIYVNTFADLPVLATTTSGTMAIVVNDPTASNNRSYIAVGSDLGNNALAWV